MPTALTLSAVPIISPAEQANDEFIFDEGNQLKTILLQDDIKDLPVAVVSVAGALREGKSFLLNFFLRYMKDNTSWLDDKKYGNTPLTGFNWKNGSKPCTYGILMWPEILTVNLANGEKVAVIFLDTQGTFDPRSSNTTNVKIFALSTLLSSMQVYNIFHLFNDNHLQQLELFSAYAHLVLEQTQQNQLEKSETIRLLMKKTQQNSFQKLQILVRNWQSSWEKPFGFRGGRSHLDEVLQNSQAQQSDQHSSSSFIRSIYPDIRCFLMPHPGAKVTQPHFDGRLSDIDEEFKENLSEFVSNLLQSENLVLKKVAGQNITVEKWYLYLERYINVFNADSLPELNTMLDAVAEIHIQSTKEALKLKYQQLMLNASEELKPYMTTEEQGNEHLRNKTEVLRQFDLKPQMGNETLYESGRVKLEKDIESEYVSFKMNNKLQKINSCQRAVADGIQTYIKKMEKSCTGADVDTYLGCDEFKKLHDDCKTEAFEKFKKGCKEAADDTNEYRLRLEEAIETACDDFETDNQAKRKASCNKAVTVGTLTYDKELKAYCVDPDKYYSEEEFCQLHETVKKRSLEKFKTGCKEADDVANEFRLQLEKGIEDNFRQQANKNKKKWTRKMWKNKLTGAGVGILAGGAIGVQVGSRVGAAIGMFEGPVGVVVGTAVCSFLGVVIGGGIGMIHGTYKACKAPRIADIKNNKTEPDKSSTESKILSTEENPTA